MTEQNATETPVVEVETASIEVPSKRFRFTRKQVAVTAAVTTAAVAAIYLKVKSNASKHTEENVETPATELEADASV